MVDDNYNRLLEPEIQKFLFSTIEARKIFKQTLFTLTKYVQNMPIYNEIKS